MNNTTCKTLTIFEGPDGAGKTTAAKQYAEAINAKYVHFSALPEVGPGLPHMYIEAMLPALLGYQDVVFDRCWISEMPYGMAFRKGLDRMTVATRRMLERAAFKCGAVVVMCNPGWDAIQSSFESRRDQELLETTEQLKTVYSLYCGQQQTDLPTIKYDYVNCGGFNRFYEGLQSFSRPICHPVDKISSGNWEAQNIIVANSIGLRGNYDNWYQLPFMSFSKDSSFQKFAQRLGAGEGEFLWVDINQDLWFLKKLSDYRRVFAVGDDVYNLLKHNGYRPILLSGSMELCGDIDNMLGVV